MIFYFAYGSNLHPVRLTERVPSASLIGVVKILKYKLLFHKKSNDGSSKCNIIPTDSDENFIYGAVYSIDQKEKKELDRFEGKGYGYSDVQITTMLDGKEYNCFTYLAEKNHIVNDVNPYHWYKEFVLQGAKYLGLPDSYISFIASVVSHEDPDEERKIKNEALIKRLLGPKK